MSVISFHLPTHADQSDIPRKMDGPEQVQSSKKQPSGKMCELSSQVYMPGSLKHWLKVRTHRCMRIQVFILYFQIFKPHCQVWKEMAKLVTFISDTPRVFMLIILLMFCIHLSLRYIFFPNLAFSHCEKHKAEWDSWAVMFPIHWTRAVL